MKTGMQRVFDGITHEQANLVWELVSGFVEDAGDEWMETEADHRKVAVATALLEALDLAQIRSIGDPAGHCAAQHSTSLGLYGCVLPANHEGDHESSDSYRDRPPTRWAP